MFSLFWMIAFVALFSVINGKAGYPCWLEAPPFQNLYCDSDFVLKVKVISSSETGDGIVYTIKTLDDYSKKKLDFQPKELHTVSRIEKGGINALVEGQRYFVSGVFEENKLIINLCKSLVISVEDTTREQTDFIQVKYRENCICKVRICTTSDDCDSDGNHCNVPYQHNDCKNKYGLCQKTGNECKWNKMSKKAKNDEICKHPAQDFLPI